MREQSISILSLTTPAFWEATVRGEIERSVKANLIFGIDDGDRLQDSFEGAKCFGCPLREVERE